MLDVNQILEMQKDMVQRWHTHAIDNPFEGMNKSICQQHSFNFLLWHEEDRARCPKATDSEIAAVKRNIDRYNQARNDWIEKLDDEIEVLVVDSGVRLKNTAVRATETPGSAIDRLSIMALRLYHLNEQLERREVDDFHLEKVRNRISICIQQREHLAQALGFLLAGIFRGEVIHRLYRQFKMYNDPTMNPFLYGVEKSKRVA